MLLFSEGVFLFPYMQRILVFFLLLTGTYAVQAQQYTVSGTLSDSVSLRSLTYTSVVLLRARDSVLVSFSRADENQQFRLSAAESGQYILLISHPDYASYNRKLQIEGAEQLDTVYLTSRRRLLEEVFIYGQEAITIKGDTVEYYADSFKTRQYDNVDELLKKLPGLEVNSDGSVVAHGKKVEKMLVDGEEFFGDDPAMVSKMLRASSVSKVQVFDKRTEQAEFTGIDDGEKIKTINLELKEDAKKGYFGKVKLGGGLPDYWENQLMFNSFKKRRKVSVYGVMSNTNQSGLSWQDSRNYGGGESVELSDGRVVTGFSDGQFNGQGLPRSWSAGAHYSNKWKGDTIGFNGSYSFSKNITEGFDNRQAQYILPDTQYFSSNRATSSRQSVRHSARTELEYKLDSLSSLRLYVNGHRSDSRSTRSRQTTSSALSGELLNSNAQMDRNEDEQDGLDASLLYRKKFKKERRTFTVDARFSMDNSRSSGIMQSDYNLYVLDSAYVLHQRKESRRENLQARSRLTYTEPLSEKLSLNLNYNIGLNNNQSDNSSYDLDEGREGGVYNREFSSNYEFNNLQSQGGLGIYFKDEDFNVSLGGDIAYSVFEHEDFILDTTFSYAYLNFFPHLRFRWQRSSQSNLSFNYRGNTNAPSLSQIQPLRNNTDPLNIVLGNPDLKQEFRHNFYLSYYSYQVISSQSFSIGGSFSFVQNAISMMQQVNISGKRIMQYVNVTGNYNAWGHVNYSIKRFFGIHTGVSLNGNYQRRINFLNGLRNRNQTYTLSPALNLRYYKDTLLELQTSFRPQYTHSLSSIRTDVPVSFWTYVQSFSGNLSLPLGFEIGSDFNWEIRQKQAVDDVNNTLFFLNAYMSKSFLKDRSLQLRFYANDLLNQNIGYDRKVLPDQVYEETFSSIRRYYMLSLTWNFTRSGAKTPDSGGMYID